MSNTNAATLNALRTLFGVRAASRLFKRSRGRASHILEEARASYGAGWDAIRAVHALMEQAFLETPASEVIDSPTRAAPFLKARLAGLGYEVFAVLFLDLCSVSTYVPDRPEQGRSGGEAGAVLNITGHRA